KERFLPRLSPCLLDLRTVAIRWGECIVIEGILPIGRLAIQQVIEEDAEDFLVGTRQRTTGMVSDIPIRRLAGFVQREVAQVVVEQALRIRRRELTDSNTTTVDHRR